MCREEIENAPHPASDDRRDADTNSKPSFAVGGALGGTKCDRDSLRCRRCYKLKELHVLVPMLMVSEMAECANSEGYDSAIAAVVMPTLTRHNKGSVANFSIS